MLLRSSSSLLLCLFIYSGFYLPPPSHPSTLLLQRVFVVFVRRTLFIRCLLVCLLFVSLNFFRILFNFNCVMMFLVVMRQKIIYSSNKYLTIMPLFTLCRRLKSEPIQSEFVKFGEIKTLLSLKKVTSLSPFIAFSTLPLDSMYSCVLLLHLCARAALCVLQRVCARPDALFARLKSSELECVYSAA